MNAECALELPGCEHSEPLAQVLAEYLIAAHCVRGPGADGLTLEDVVATEYPAALSAGHVPGPDEVASQHPELAAEVVAFFGHEHRPASAGE
jgi:hypothetical protein